MTLTIDDIAIGDSYSDVVEFTPERMRTFLEFSGDAAAIHTSRSFSGRKGYEDLVVYGFLLSAHFSRILGMHLPGENSVIGSVELGFHSPVYVGDVVTYTATVTRILKPLGSVALDLSIVKDDGTKCVAGKTTCVFPNRS